MIILSIDPGMGHLGWAVLRLGPKRKGSTEDGLELLSAGHVGTKPTTKKILTSLDNVDRLKKIMKCLGTAIDGYDEGQGFIVAEAQSWPRNSSACAKIGMVWGHMVSLSEEWEWPLIQVQPQEIKEHMTGKRSASKDAVQKAVLKIYPKAAGMLEDLAKGKREHPYDAIAAALTARAQSDLIKTAVGWFK